MGDPILVATAALGLSLAVSAIRLIHCFIHSDPKAVVRAARFIAIGLAALSIPLLLGCRSALCWNSMWRNLQRDEVIVSGGEVNWLIDNPCAECLPTIDLAHVDLTGGEQRPEQHCGGLG